MKQNGFAVTLATIAAIGAGASHADTVCMPAGEMRAALIDWYGEAPVEGATAEDRQLWASSRTGTWTLSQKSSEGMACVIAQGTHWTGGAAGSALLALLDD